MNEFDWTHKIEPRLEFPITKENAHRLVGHFFTHGYVMWEIEIVGKTRVRLTRCDGYHNDGNIGDNQSTGDTLERLLMYINEGVWKLLIPNTEIWYERD